MQEKRIEGTIAADYKGQMTEVEKKDNSDWKKQHQEMISAIREAKKHNVNKNTEPEVQILS